MNLIRRISRLEDASKRRGDLRKPTFGEWLAAQTGDPEHRQYRTMREFSEANLEEQQ